MTVRKEAQQYLWMIVKGKEGITKRLIKTHEEGKHNKNKRKSENCFTEDWTVEKCHLPKWGNGRGGCDDEKHTVFVTIMSSEIWRIFCGEEKEKSLVRIWKGKWKIKKNKRKETKFCGLKKI